MHYPLLRPTRQSPARAMVCLDDDESEGRYTRTKRLAQDAAVQLTGTKRTESGGQPGLFPRRGSFIWLIGLLEAKSHYYTSPAPHPCPHHAVRPSLPAERDPHENWGRLSPRRPRLAGRLLPLVQVADRGTPLRPSRHCGGPEPIQLLLPICLYSCIVISSCAFWVETRSPRPGTGARRTTARIDTPAAWVKNKASSGLDVQVISHKRQRHGPWFGGSLLGQMPEFKSYCHTEAEYDEIGPSTVGGLALLGGLGSIWSNESVNCSYLAKAKSSSLSIAKGCLF
ncbi:uncharacterized protein BDZ99DRAFT_477185 [Mytilinidion resinicola]|uniref:Uncharacterized protein n=1 Tax=Mytilinidion resinicola TaxID=574789 RepID=A0A6A6YMM1_9PEZI|nr:uncharacterized protein BDZ99DRAFT_477185 [Mytilinidion resinicola]KAF2809823.1 hypothetical protein BDZ99DRAFT_477185 [Mytilinidion resinicola]